MQLRRRYVERCVGRGGEEKGHGKGHAATALPNFADVAASTGGQFEGAYHRPHPPPPLTST